MNHLFNKIFYYIIVGAIIVFSYPTITQAQSTASPEGCCEKVDKTNKTITAEQTTEARCEEIRPDYAYTTFYKDRRAFADRCRNERDISLNSSLPKFTIPQLQVSIPGFGGFIQPDLCPNSEKLVCIDWIPRYIVSIVDYLIGAIGIIAVVVLMAGGIVWLTSGGNAQTVGRAKQLIQNSLIGLILAFSSYLLLSLINPALINLESLRVLWIPTIALDELRSGSCPNGDCSQVDQATSNNSLGIPGAIIKSIVAGGEECSPALSGDGRGGCGYGQVLPQYRRTVCGLAGDKTDCDLFKNDIQADINCAAKMLAEQAPRCGNFSDIKITASCYNSGNAQNCGTADYCLRVQDYFNNKCGASQTSEESGEEN